MRSENPHGTGKKHIAMYIGSLNKGGAERVLCNLAEYFNAQGYKVTFVTTYLADDEYEVEGAAWKAVKDEFGTDDKEIPGSVLEVLSPEDEPRRVFVSDGNDGRINRVFSGLMPAERGGRITNFFRRISKLRNIWKSLKPDIILSFLGKNNVMAIYSAKGLGIPVVVSVRSNPSREYASRGLNMSMNMLFPGAAGVVVQTTGARDYFKESVKRKCRILPNSIHPAFINEKVTEFKDRTKTIVSVGRLDDNKNQILLIKAFGKIMDKYPEYRLVLYGDGPSRSKLEEAAGSLMKGHDPEQIVFMGNQNNIPSKIKDADIFVLTSKQEGMPNALIEAMALGLACVSTDCPCGGPGDLIRDGENGILIPMKDEETMVSSLSDALVRLITDREFCEKIGNNALSVRNIYSPEKINGQWKEYFEDIMTK